MMPRGLGGCHLLGNLNNQYTYYNFMLLSKIAHNPHHKYFKWILYPFFR